MNNKCSGLIDSFGRSIDYLRVSVTDRCDLRCRYCLPEKFKDFTTPDHWLTIDEVTRVVDAFAVLGVKRVRLTGGEPLLRHDLPQLANQLKHIQGIDDLSLSSNCTRMSQLADHLYSAGIRRLNVSLDTLRAERYREITGGGKLDKALSGIEAARTCGFDPIKINTVLMRGVNDDEVDDLLNYCAENGFILRLIESMPVGRPGQRAHKSYIDLQEVRHSLEQRYELIRELLPGGGPASYFKVADLNVHFGLITPISQHFCESCNRLRLTVDGTLHLCLGQNHQYPLRDILRSGVTDGELGDHIRAAVALKPERHEFKERPEQVVHFMSSTGG
ncbi:MAG: GTP 3',8-cyclase MoaA [Candidatus Thiodiazotropha sp. (ex Monitilora ramsayi)]|nr:GTP 3',8-cyclase MoaA [Candidatus Thiodiazotropha sp. (ex Monitilora ramsayi)]